MKTARVRAGLGGLAAIALACIGLLQACSTTQVRTRGDGDLSEFRTYAWVAGPKTAEPFEGDVDDRFERAIEIELAKKGLQKVADDEAELMVRRSTSIEVKTRYNDPYFSFWLVEKYEAGTLMVDFLDAKTGRAVWRGTGTRRLRELARGVGPGEIRWAEQDQERNWPVENMVREILGALPNR